MATQSIPAEQVPVSGPRVRVVRIQPGYEGDRILVELSDGLVVVVTIADIEEAIGQSRPN